MKPLQYLRVARRLWKSDDDLETYIAVGLLLLTVSPYVLAWWQQRD